MKGFITSRKEKLDEFLRKNVVYVTPIMLFGGFFIHTLTFDRIDQVFENVVIIFYLFVVGIAIAILVGSDSRLGKFLKVKEREFIITAIALFAFGSLFSAFLIFYSKSGTIISSWPFITLLLILMLGPELRKRYFYQKTILQISIFYTAIFCYLIFLLPVILKKMGPDIYLLSGVISLLLIYLYILLLNHINREGIRTKKKGLVIRILSIFAIFNVLYFTNIIPPIPLSLGFRAVYHDFSRVQGSQYQGYYEEASKWEFWKVRSNVFHRVNNEPIFVYSQIYAPINLETVVYHQWEYFDPDKTRWVETDRIKIQISGGRQEGYRGYSKKTNFWPGSWRVKIVTERGQTLGQIVFKVDDSKVFSPFKEDIFK
jgi:hypothetical protein